MKYKIIDGNEACSLVSYKFVELAGIYPITPASPMAEYIDKYSHANAKNFFGDTVSVVEMQSEAGAIAMLHGALQNGTLATTYTASQGLLLMIPNMYKIAGEMLPCVINVAARSIATHALSILGDHQDVYAVRQTGFAMFATSSPQQVMDLTAVPYLASLKGKIPFVNFFDGFRTSHELQKVELIDLNKVKSLIDKKSIKEFKNKALSINNVTRGTNQNDDIYFQISEARNKYYDELPDIVNKYMEDISNITGRQYKPFDYYGDEKATNVIVAMGSVCETIKDTVDYLNEHGERVGLIEVHLYRPFSSKYLLNVLPKTVKNIAVLDRTKEAGAASPLYLDVKDVIGSHNPKIKVVGGRYGLASKNTTPYQIKSVYSYLNTDNTKEFTIGIVDDVTNLSLEEEHFDISNKDHEILIYGYGSDGMVSASKDIIKIIGNNTKAYTQGYFEYDSKKSGGLTRCHLRFGSSPIRATYYIEKPDMVVCTKDDYLDKYNMLEAIKENGIFILNTDKTESELLDALSYNDKKVIVDRNIKVYLIDANDIAHNNDLGNKINMIMATTIFKVSNIIPFNFAHQEMKNSLQVVLTNKGREVIDKNIMAIDESLSKITSIEIKKNSKKSQEFINNSSVFEFIEKKEGYKLKVSELEQFIDGTFLGGLSKKESKNIAEKLPCYNPENCIMCNQCSFVCPHAVVRPFLLDEKESARSPKIVKEKLKDALIKDNNLKYTIGVDFKNCTGCGLCSKVCPGKKGQKAIEMVEQFNITKEDRISEEYLFDSVKVKEVLPISTLKGSQFVKPKFEFSGACAGCGQTPYLKLLTQLFGNELVISNATGCSSIYGGSVPKTTYSIPWANSLFEDNAEFGFGMAVSDRINKERIKNIIYKNIEKVTDAEKEIYASYYKRCDYASSCLLYEFVNKNKTRNKELYAMKQFIKTKSFWIVGGDGWAYDIGFGGLDHVLASNENVNILVLDTEVYSNTGGQASKSTPTAAVAKFASAGKKSNKKDLARIALSYPNVYVATISLGANMNQTIKTMIEAKNHNGPSIIIAYSPCIAHGVINGLDSISEQKKATNCGYFPIFRYNPETEVFTLDNEPDFSSYFEFILGEDRYRTLKKVNSSDYKELLEKNKEEAINRYKYYKNLSNKNEK